MNPNNNRDFLNQTHNHFSDRTPVVINNNYYKNPNNNRVFLNARVSGGGTSGIPSSTFCPGMNAFSQPTMIQGYGPPMATYGPMQPTAPMATYGPMPTRKIPAPVNHYHSDNSFDTKILRQQIDEMKPQLNDLHNYANQLNANAQKERANNVGGAPMNRQRVVINSNPEPSLTSHIPGMQDPRYTSIPKNLVPANMNLPKNQNLPDYTSKMQPPKIQSPTPTSFTSTLTSNLSFHCKTKEQFNSIQSYGLEVESLATKNFDSLELPELESLSGQLKMIRENLTRILTKLDNILSESESSQSDDKVVNSVSAYAQTLFKRQNRVQVASYYSVGNLWLESAVEIDNKLNEVVKEKRRREKEE